MKKKETIIEIAAVILTIGLLGGTGVTVAAYQHHRVLKEAAGAQVVELYASAQRGVWTETPLTGWNASFRHAVKKPIHVRAGRPILFRLTSVDVHHSFSIPELRILPKDVTPGRWTDVRVDPLERGIYTITCYTVCGMQHSSMDAELHAD